MKLERQKHIQSLLLLVGLIMISHRADAYALSIRLSHIRYETFDYNNYAYSSLFQQGRDFLHWLDLSYANYDYVLTDERGHSKEIGVQYRFSRRLRWSRYFKPYFFTGLGATRITQTERIKVKDNISVADLAARETIHYQFFTGTGYLWEINNMLIGFTVDYGYEDGYDRTYLTPALMLSLIL